MGGGRKGEGEREGGEEEEREREIERELAYLPEKLRHNFNLLSSTEKVGQRNPSHSVEGVELMGGAS